MNERLEHENGLTVVGIGEALFDCFPEGALLGGAPVNLALHADQLLRQVGGRGVVVSASPNIEKAHGLQPVGFVS